MIEKYKLENEYLKATFLNIGASIYELETQNKDGVFENIVLGYEDIEDYYNNPAFLGVVVGQIPGRIKDGRFILRNKEYQLDLNDQSNHLHGGKDSFAKKIWEVSKLTKTSITFYLTSKHLENGYPGNLNIWVKYTLIDNRLKIDYSASSDCLTIMDFTNHSYFNLSGNLKETILNHELQINADFYQELDEIGMVKNKLASVDNSPFDLRKKQVIGEVFKVDNEQLKNGHGGFDHPFLTNNEEVALLVDNNSKRYLKVYSNQEAVVCYCSSLMDDSLVLQNGRVSQKYLGVCLETQYLPNAINMQDVKQPIYDESKMFNSTTIFEFGIIE